MDISRSIWSIFIKKKKIDLEGEPVSIYADRKFVYVKIK